MRKKLLYFLITIFGAATLVSGYQLYGKVQNPNFKVQKNIEKTVTITKIEKEKNQIESVTGDRLQANKVTTPTNTPTQQPDTPTTTEINPEEIFEPKVVLQINGIELLVPYSDRMTAEDAMRQVQEKYPDKFWYERIEYGGDLGTFVKSINGIAENNREKMHWILYINGKKSNRGISSLILNPDDIIKWNYEKEIL